MGSASAPCDVSGQHLSGASTGLEHPRWLTHTAGKGAGCPPGAQLGLSSREPPGSSITSPGMAARPQEGAFSEDKVEASSSRDPFPV